MNKKNVDEIENLLQQSADKITFKPKKEEIIAKSLMLIAKEELITTFSEKQKILYEKYISAKQKYFDIINKQKT